MVTAMNGKPNFGKRGPDKKPRKKRGGLRKPVGYVSKSVIKGIVKKGRF
jgi:hypothetical protein